MKFWTLATAAAVLATGATAGERQFLCVSDTDGTEYRLTSSESGNEGTVQFNETVSEAKVFPGLDNLTFMVANEQNVMTFFVKQPDLSFTLSVSRPTPSNMRGQCQEIAL